MRSLFRTLSVGTFAVNLGCIAVFSSFATVHEMHGRRRGFDATLHGRAAVEAANHSLASFDDPTRQTIVLCMLADPHSWPGDVHLTPESLAELRKHSASGLDYKGRQYRGLFLSRAGPCMASDPKSTWLFAMDPGDLRHEAWEAVAYYASVGGALLVVLASLLAWFLRNALSPLEGLASAAAAVRPSSWTFTPPASALALRELRPSALALERSLKELRDAYVRQEQFTSDAAHELRTALAVMRSSLQLLLLAPRTTDEYYGGLLQLVADTERLEALLLQMLHLARLESKSDGLDSQTSDFSMILTGIAERLQPFAQVREVTLWVENSPALIAAAPAADVEVILSNLIVNALQHTPPGGCVKVIGLREPDAFLRCCVKDEGPGFGGSDPSRLFERFARSDLSRSRETGGTGLGLALCRAAARRAGGDVMLGNRVGAQGAEAVLRLPMGYAGGDRALPSGNLKV